MRTIWAIALCAMLAGCGSLQANVIGGCELPSTLSAKDSVTDLPTDHPLTPAEQRGYWAKDRKHLRQAVDHGNALIDYVSVNCK